MIGSHRGWRTTSMLVIGLFLLGICLAAGGDTPARPPVTQGPAPDQIPALIGSVGAVEVQRAGEEVWAPIEQGALAPGDRVRTEAGSLAELRLVGHVLVRLRASSMLEIPESVTGTDDRPLAAIALIGGNIWALAGGDVKLEVTTPSAVAEASAAAVGVQVRENGGERFDVYAGEAAVTPTARDGLAGAGRRAVVEAGQNAAIAPRGVWIGVGDSTDIEEAVGLVVGRPDISGAEVLPDETEGNRVVLEEVDDWRLEVYESPGVRHGILVFEGLAVRQIETTQLNSPFGLLHYHGLFRADGGDASGWLPATVDAAALPAPAAVMSRLQHGNEHISMAKSAFATGEQIELRWHDLPQNRGDWIAVVPADAIDSTWGEWWYTRRQESGVRVIKGLAPGAYQVRVYFDWPNGGYKVQSRMSFTVGEEPPAVGTPALHVGEHITLAKAVFSTDDEITVNWQDLPGNRSDWIAVVPADSPDNTWGTWWYAEGRQSGSREIGKQAAGRYEVRVYFNWPQGGYTVQSRLQFTVQ